MNPYRWQVPLNHAAFAGHFPGTPILPGVVLLDVALNIIAETYQLTLDECEIGSVKFLSPVSPGDTLAFHHERLTSGTIRFEIRSAETLVASGTILPSPPK